ncbi:xanthine phosphoribosyltransferase [Vibrio sp. SS-MA-C1-2]|uniref:xanthine phosphoribosyltransferase n=1 Tax=Vibrio sp. SS-MA-C1-2 TaxID=2908646 RepID=UPI001F1CE902|nr:xanthine phosphoribosyltransferase [Vibrio sp. SS-MA-C1-2]UJF18127.1 xanthine phosphoribosyltransferase [Vibrio sp. SS-MA-C1-2]
MMNLLEKRILEQGRAFNGVALDASQFLTRQIDISLLDYCATMIADKFKQSGATRVVTIESGGIAISTLVALKLGLPLVLLKKQLSILDDQEMLLTNVHSFTKNISYQLNCVKSHLPEGSKLLFIDDVLAHGNALEGILSIAEQAEATVVGGGFLFEKSFQQGHQLLESNGIASLSLARISSLKNGIELNLCSDSLDSKELDSETHEQSSSTPINEVA